MPTVDADLLNAVAHHEAAHAVVNRLRGIDVEAVEVSDALTKTSIVGLGDLEMNPPSRDEYRRRAEPFLVGQLAGGIAERRYTGADTDSGSDDLQNALLLAIDICPEELGYQAYLEEMYARAVEAVDVNWEAIQRVAGRLVEAGRIDGPELDRLITESGR
jgi:ATP-dependent Zn protease